MLRTCKKCGLEKDLSCFPKHKECHLGYEHKCKKCKRIISRKSTNKSRKKRYHNDADYRYVKRNNAKKQVINLADSYIKKKLRQINIKNPTKELIELKRKQLQLKRLSYEKQKSGS